MAKRKRRTYVSACVFGLAYFYYIYTHTDTHKHTHIYTQHKNIHRLGLGSSTSKHFEGHERGAKEILAFCRWSQLIAVYVKIAERTNSAIISSDYGDLREICFPRKGRIRGHCRIGVNSLRRTKWISERGSFYRDNGIIPSQMFRTTRSLFRSPIYKFVAINC